MLKEGNNLKKHCDMIRQSPLEFHHRQIHLNLHIEIKWLVTVILLLAVGFHGSEVKPKFAIPVILIFDC